MNARTNHTILFVDDEKSILKSLRRLFFDDDYHIITAESGKEALSMLAAGEKPTVIVSDQRMPEMGGAEFLAEARKILPESIRMVLTGYADINAAIDAVNLGGVYRYIMKPWNDDDLKLTIKEAISRFDLAEENRLLSLELEQKNRDLAELNAALELKVEERTVALRKLVRELEGRDRIQQYLMQVHPLDELLQTILSIILEATDCKGAAFLLVDDENRITSDSLSSNGFQVKSIMEENKPLAELTGQVVMTGEAARPALDKLKDFAVVPVSRRDKIFGALLLQKRGGSPVDDKELLTYAGFAGQAAIGIHDCRFQENFEDIETSLDEVLSAF